MVQNFFFLVHDSWIYSALPTLPCSVRGRQPLHISKRWLGQQGHQCCWHPPIGFYITNLNATHAAFLYPAVGQSGTTCNQMQRRYWDDTKRELWVFIFSAPKSEHNGCFRGTIGRLHLFHLLRDGGLRAYVASWFSICFWNFIFSFYYYPLINWCIHFAKYKNIWAYYVCL